MWDPGFVYGSVLSARVLGWHRRFSLVSTASWGTDANPGLCAVLHRGGTSWGRAFAVAPNSLDQALQTLDQREAAYLRRDVWLEVIESGKRRRRQAITYVANPAHPRLRADLTRTEQLCLVRQGKGAKGTSRSYLQNTADCLTTDGHFHTDAHRFLAMIN